MNGYSNIVVENCSFVRRPGSGIFVNGYVPASRVPSARR